MSFTSKKLFLYLVSSNLFSIPNLHSPRKLNTNWYSVNKLSLLLLIISHFSTPKIRELLFSIPNNDAAPVRRKGWGIKIPEVILHQWKATFVSSSEPQTLLGALATDKHLHPRGRSQLPRPPPPSCCVSTHTFHCPPSAATRALKSPLSFKNPQVGVHKAQVNLYVGVWFREARRGCSSSYADRIYSTPSHERCSVPFVLFLIFMRGKDLKKDISAQPNSQLHISVLSPEMNRMQWCELLQ